MYHQGFLYSLLDHLSGAVYDAVVETTLRRVPTTTCALTPGATNQPEELASHEDPKPYHTSLNSVLPNPCNQHAGIS